MKKIITLLALTVLCFAAFGLTACSGGDHEHIYEEWTTTRDPTCAKEGLKEAACKVCGKKTTRVIARTAHDFTGEETVIVPPECEKDGEKHIACKNGCGEYKTEIIMQTGHDYSGEATTIEPTCTSDGERRIVCKNGCGKDKVTKLTSLGHKYDEEGSIVKEPTCEEDGLRSYKCERCEKEISETIEALGHVYGDFVVDTPSSSTSDGQKSRHCLRSGCSSKIDVTVLPKGESMDYSVKVLRSDGSDYEFLAELKAAVYDGETKVKEFTFSDGRAEISANADKGCKVVIEGLRSGYSQETEAILGRNEAVVNITVKGSIVANDGTSPSKRLVEGDAMRDFVVRDTKSVNKKFSELLSGKKGAYIFLFYVGCGACAQQFPVFIEQYNLFANKNDFLVVMLNVYPSSNSGQTFDDMESYRSKKGYPTEFYMASANLGSTNVFDWVQRPSGYRDDVVPFSFFIDGEGIIDRIVLSEGTSAMRKVYEEALTKLLGQSQKEGTTQIKAVEAALPNKQSIFD